MSIPARWVYRAESGDAVYRIRPTPGAFGFLFSCSGDPSGAQLPTAVLLRAGRVFLMRPDTLRGSGYVTDVKPAIDPTRPTGVSESAWLYAANIKWRLWAVANAIDPDASGAAGPASSPSWVAAGDKLESLEVAASAWGWARA